MPYSFMNLRELAVLLGIDERRAEKLAQRKQIPCQKVGQQLRFNRDEIIGWLQQNMPTLDQKNLASMDAGVTIHRKTKPEELLITPLLRPEAISNALPARTKNSVLKELVALAQETELLYDGESLLENLTKREELCSTAMEGGFAIPHPRRPIPYAIEDSILVVACTSQGIGFGAPDGRLTDLFFMTCSKDDRHHLHLLARLCRLLYDEKFPLALRNATNPDQVIKIIAQREAQIVAESAN